MRGYYKIKDGNLFSQRSNSRKDFPFLDADFDVPRDFYASKNSRSSLENEPKPTIIIDEDSNNNKKNDFILGKQSIDQHDHDHGEDQYEDHDQDEQLHVKNDGERKKIRGVLKRNFTVSSSTSSFAYQKSSYESKNNNLDRQSSKRGIQQVVKRAFSMRRSSSVNSERYCRIYDQSLHVQDFDDYDCVLDDRKNGDYNHQDDEFERSNSMRKKMNNKVDDDNMNSPKLCVRSKFTRACKRLFNR